ncbi:MAG: glycosyltransferase [Acidimicrobiia bacterium]
MEALTIVARNYLSQARVVARSFAEHHRLGRFHVVVLDVGDDDEFGDEPFEVISPFDIGIERDEFLRMATMYDVTELATAIKPWALRTLLDRTGTSATYLDPDILVMAPLDDLHELALQHSIVLTPHVLAPLPRDGLLPREETLMLSGMYNLGYISVGPGSEPFLQWWSARLSRWAIVSQAEGLFTDQRWVDFVPSLFACTINRDPGYNAAHWNLHERPIGMDEGRFTAGGVPLKFFHYSGFDPAVPHLLSKYLGDRPRELLSERPALRALLEVVTEHLTSVGIGDTRSIPYRYATSSGGLALTTGLRRMYRDAVLSAEAEGTSVPAHAFAGDGFFDWLSEPVIGPIDHQVSRFVEYYYRSHADLPGRFPDLNGDSAEHLMAWARSDNGFAREVPAALVPGPPPPATLVVDRPPTAGINIVGYFEAELGVGEAGRLAVAAVEAAGIDMSTLTYRATTSRQREVFSGRGMPGCPYDTTLLCVNADQTPRAMQALGSRFTQSRRTVGMWFWEVDEFPARFHHAFDLVDEVWAPSTFIAELLRPLSSTPVFEFPLPVMVGPERTTLDRRAVGFPDGHVFLFAFDYLSVFERKNPIGLITAFCEAFEPRDGAHLVIKTINAPQRVTDHEALLFAARSRPDIHIISEYVSATQMRAMIELSDCFVSLHRSEGFGLSIAQAMALGKPTIATGYSGNMSFMTAENSYPVPFQLIEVGHGHGPYPATARWAQPDLGRAAQIMREVVDDPGSAGRRGRRAAEDLASSRSVQRAAGFVSERFDQWSEASEHTRSAKPRTAARQAARLASALRSTPGRLKRYPHRGSS